MSTYVEIEHEIDIEDYLDEVPTKVLQRELASRTDGGSIPTSALLAADLRSAFYARDASRFEALLREIEPIPTKPIPKATAVAEFRS